VRCITGYVVLEEYSCSDAGRAADDCTNEDSFLRRLALTQMGPLQRLSGILQLSRAGAIDHKEAVRLTFDAAQ
jgi:hypothetical protein